MAVLVAGCGGDSGGGTTTVTVTQTETTTVTEPATTDERPDTPAASLQRVDVFLADGERLAVAHRRVRTTAPATAAMRELLAAPTAADRGAGLSTLIPAGTELLGVRIEDGTATVDLSSRFESGGGSASMQLRVAQVVFTLTQFPTVRRVAFELDGRAVTSIGGEGVLVSPPVDRIDFEAQAPPILVTDPAPGDTAQSPLRVSGSANVFEAVLFVELRDGARVVATRRVMASSGTGTRGTFSTTLAFDDATPLRSPVLVAFDRSPRDGSRQDEVRVELTGAPS